MYFLLPIMMSLSAWARQDLKPDFDVFLESCRSHRQQASSYELEPPELGMETYFPTLALQASQSRFSYKKLLSALKKATKEEPGGLSFDNKRSLYGMKKKIKAAFYRGKLYIVDGHHRAMISTYLRAETIPVKIVGVFNDSMDPQEFMDEMESRGWAYWRDAYGVSTGHFDLCDMVNDPNLQLARLLIRRVTVTLENGHLKLSDSRGADVSLAVKINSDIPFFEFHIADALTRAGIRFDDTRKESDFSMDELRSYLQILQAEAKLPGAILQKVLLLDRPREEEDLHLEKIVIKHLQEDTCEGSLKSPGGSN